MKNKVILTLFLLLFSCIEQGQLDVHADNFSEIPTNFEYKIVIRKIISQLQIQMGINGNFHEIFNSSHDNTEINPPIEIDITHELQINFPNTLLFRGFSGSFAPPRSGTTSTQFQYKIVKRLIGSSGAWTTIIDRWNAEMNSGVAQGTLIYVEAFDIVKE